MKFRNSSSVRMTARNFLLAERSRKPKIGGIHGGERGVIILTGTTSLRKGRVVLTKVTDLKSVFGKSKPGKANG